MTYEEAVQTINSLLRFGIKPGLERMQKLLDLLGNPQDSLKFVHVAGTNGKGSTCALLSSVLTRAGYRTGLYSSPYISDFRERFQIDGEMIAKAELVSLVEQVNPLVQSMAKAGEIITEFEFITALAFLWFAQRRCGVVVLEVGLGGRLDATNVIQTPLVSVIASISLDHTAVLGDTVEQIAAEKAGIIKPGGIVVCYPRQPGGVMQVFRDTAARKHSRMIVAGEPLQELSTDLRGTNLLWRGLPLCLPFLGEHQLLNAQTALAALAVLRQGGLAVSDEAVQAGFAAAYLPARLEVLSLQPPVLLDGAHNPGGTAALAAALRRYLPQNNRVAVMGMLADKDVDTALDSLGGLFSHVLTLTPKNPRAMEAQELSARWQARGVPAEPQTEGKAALQRALELAGEEGAVVICGSLYLAGEVRPAAVELLRAR